MKKYYRVENKNDKTDFTVLAWEDHYHFEDLPTENYVITEISKEQYEFSLDKLVRPMAK